MSATDLVDPFESCRYSKWTCIMSCMSLNFSQMGLLTLDMAALEHLKNPCHHFFLVDIDLILFKLASYKELHKILEEFEFAPDLTT